MIISMKFVVPIIVLCIIALQFYFFRKNLKRMHQFRDIFNGKESWELIRDDASGFVKGIYGLGNEIFESISVSINKYLNNSVGSVIDYNLLKDAVDRHCETVEDDISTQTPVPLYCGLAGTMLGVIIGLGSLLFTNSITSLMTNVSSQQSAFYSAADGVSDLLTGVAWAMVASIFGIGLTTVNSLLFKKCKLQEESGKNEFLAWMQSELLPELPSDTSDALNKLVKNLNRFNSTFSSNTRELGGTLSRVNESYRIQADIIQAVHDMDVMKMAKANVNVLHELKECTDKLQEFQCYLDSVKGYTSAIEKFNEQFFAESERLHVLEEIRDFFTRNKAEIAKNLTDETDVLKTAIKTLQDTSVSNMAELEKVLTEEVDTFKTINKQLLDQFTSQLDAFPKMYKNLELISQIPSALKDLASKIEKSNSIAIEKISKKVDRIEFLTTTTPEGGRMETTFPLWGKILFVLCAFLLFASSLFMGFCSYRIMCDTSVIRDANSVVEQDSVSGSDSLSVFGSDSLPHMVNKESIDTAVSKKWTTNKKGDVR